MQERVSGLDVFPSRPSYKHRYGGVGWEFWHLSKEVLTHVESPGLFSGELGVRSQ